MTSSSDSSENSLSLPLTLGDIDQQAHLITMEAQGFGAVLTNLKVKCSVSFSLVLYLKGSYNLAGHRCPV